MTESATTQQTKIWARIIIGCGAFAFAFSGFMLFHILVSLRESSDGDANGMIRFFLCLFVPPFFASFRLLFRRKWAGIVVALFGWFWIYDLLSSPVGFGQFDWVTGAANVSTLILTAALFYGEKAWKRGF